MKSASEPRVAARPIDELARRTGVTSRNIRAYQASGSLPAPSRKGRVRYHDDGHRGRLEVIRDLRARGPNLDSIGGVLKRVPSASSDDLRAFARAITAALFTESERPALMTGAN